MSKMSPLISLLVLLAAPAAAQRLLVDDEPCNNAIPVSGPCPSGPSIQLTSIGAGVVTAASDEFSLHAFQNDKFDYFGIAGLVAGDIVVVSTTPLEDPPDFEVPDTIVGLFDSSTLDPALERLCIGDDAFNSELPGFMTGFGSLCRFEIQTAGTYYVGITGWGGDIPMIPFDGSHFQIGDYAVTATIISAPEPGLMLQLAAGVLGVGALNKRRLRTKCRIEHARAV